MEFAFWRKREVSTRWARLRELSLLADLNPAELRHVDVLLHEREYVRDEIIFDEGEEGQALYIVLEGEVAIVRARDGKEQLLGTLLPGDFFGEMALLDRAPRGARAKASSNCRMAVLFREDLAGLLATHAVVGSKITPADGKTYGAHRSSRSGDFDRIDDLVSAKPTFIRPASVKRLFDPVLDKTRLDFRDLRFARRSDSGATAGPIVWVLVLITTCLMLYLLQKVLILVVPFLFALVLFYALCPIMARLVLWGLARETAALIVIGVFCLVAAVILTAVLPRAVGALTDNQDLIKHYLDGGIGMLQRTLESLEKRSSLIAQAHLSEALNAQLEHANGSTAERIQGVFIGLLGWGPSLALVPFLAYFLLKDSRRFASFLSRAVPNAFFETTLSLLHGVDKAARAYFQGLLQLTVLDTLTLAAGLWMIGLPAPFTLALIAAVLAWIPYVGSIVGGLLVALVAAADFANDPAVTLWTVLLFGFVRLLDDFIYMPMTIGKSLRIHPLITVLTIFVGGGIAGIPGLMLGLPLLGIILVVGETVGVMLTNPRLVARYRQGRALRRHQASEGLTMPGNRP